MQDAHRAKCREHSRGTADIRADDRNGCSHPGWRRMQYDPFCAKIPLTISEKLLDYEQTCGITA